MISVNEPFEDNHFKSHNFNSFSLILSRAVILQKLDLSTTATLGTEKSGQRREVAVSRDSTVPNIHFIDSIFKVSCLVRES